jgi:Dehydrogenases with different specificities (related to short-chain alcohol dehydrogenases)
MLLKDRIAIITGAGGGLGVAIAAQMAKAGATVVLTDIAEAPLEKAGKEMETIGAQYSTFVMDVTNKAQVNEVVDATVEKYGRIDVLMNNSGGSLFTPKALQDIEEKHWDLVLDVNVKGSFFCAQAVAPYMIKQGKGRIINTSSIGGRTASLVTGVAYAAAKGGIISFTRRLAKELGPNGITVNAIAPGTVMSGQRMIDLWNELTEAQKQDILTSIPLGRLSTAEEVADVVVFLASDMAGYITGSVIDINGGRHMA